MNELAYKIDQEDAAVVGADEDSDAYVPAVPRISIQGFCESSEVAETLQSVAEDRRLARAHVAVQMGGIDAAVEFYQSAPTPNLIILESRAGRDAILRDLGRLAEVCDSGTKVVVVGHVNDVLLYRELIRRGVSEYLVAPLTIVQTIQTVASLYGDPEAEPLGRVVAFVGAKGGSGSSTIAHNIAWGVAKNLSTEVVIADMDLPFGTASLDFNQDPTQGLADAVYAPERLDDVLLDRLLAKCGENLSLFAAPASLDRDFDLSAAAYDPIIDIVRKNVPVVVVDLPHQWNGWIKKVLLAADDIVITAEPDLANLRNAKNILELIKQGRPNDRKPFLLMNKVGMPKRPEISTKDFAEAMGIEPTAVIAFDPQLFGTAANNGQMIQEISQTAKPNEAFAHLASMLTGKGEVKPTKQALLALIMSKLMRKKS